MPDTTEPPIAFVRLRYWDRGVDVAKRWYHEEWEGSHIQWALARDIAEAIEEEVSEEVIKEHR